MKYNKKILVYIAGPFSGHHKENTDNAIMVGKIATKKGYAPIIPHTSILSGAYGDDDNLEERKNGINITLSILENVCNCDKSELWIISSETAVLSTGTKLELELWKKLKGDKNIKILSINSWELEYQKILQQ